jgi:hypothetical protein
MGEVSYPYTVPPVNSATDGDPADIGPDADMSDEMDDDSDDE